MAKTPNIGIRIDPELYKAFKRAVHRRGETVTTDLERHMSEVAGVPISRPGRRTVATMAVRCDFCDAAPQEKCRDKRGDATKPVGRPHPQRVRAARAANDSTEALYAEAFTGPRPPAS